MASPRALLAPVRHARPLFAAHHASVRHLPLPALVRASHAPAAPPPTGDRARSRGAGVTGRGSMSGGDALDVPPHVAKLAAAALAAGGAPVPPIVANALIGFPDLLRRGPLDAGERAKLTALAAARPDLAWTAQKDIATARNAHKTNTVDELVEALVGDYDYFETDIRYDRAGTVVCNHDKDQPDGIALEEWLDVVVASGRGMKFDVKEARAIVPVLEALKRRGVPGYRVLMNVTVLEDDPTAVASDADLRACRSAFPDAVINLSFTDYGFTPAVVAKVTSLARSLGGPIMFPLRADHVTPAVVAALKPFGKIALWNSPLEWSPADLVQATAQFRAMGVDGMIDLRQL